VKILIFEYITGGGFSGGELPVSLAREGGLMLNALLNDFSKLPEHAVTLMMDERLSNDAQCAEKFAQLTNLKMISVKASDDVFAVFENALQDCDAAWIIAPETDNILFDFTQRVETARKLLLSSPSSAIAKTADKLQTFQILDKNNIPTIPTQRLSDLSGFKNLKGLTHVIKPIDGVGCENSFFIENQTEFSQILEKITAPQRYIIQPFISGNALSVSAIFKHGQAQLICVNRQNLEVKNQQFQLLACEVNIKQLMTASPLENWQSCDFQNVLNKIAAAFPDLFGYVGIDVIVSDKIYVVEINPRLTSSYAGIYPALGINIADCVLQSHTGTALIAPSRNQTICVDLTQDANNVV
jgi:predicted ATP-grasp superfamily ATP-dependent carboligase